MKNALKILPLLGVGLLLTASLARPQFGTSTGTTNVTVTIGAQAGLNITNSSTPLTATGTNFNTFTGSTGLTYFIRTSASGGSGSITLKVTSDFTPSGGPSVATPPTAGDALAYACTVGSPGTACTGTQTSSTTTSTAVATFGADAHTSTAGSTASIAWTLTNDPKYKTGTYDATVTFTISAT